MAGKANSKTGSKANNKDRLAKQSKQHSGKVVSLDGRRVQAQSLNVQNAQPGNLFWLHCPQCKTLEYSEIAVPSGRRHKCGTVVEEVEVKVDLRAEASVAAFNLKHLEALKVWLEAERDRQQDYLKRLEIAAGGKLFPYPLVPQTFKDLPLRAIGAHGTLLSDFLYQPQRRFPDLQKEEDNTS